ncbi:MAG TPA: ThuA domain-containing protein [Draconibacterium sp.]|nr:ThuA domain-containing protein [Draconibacterium sp.]
MIKKLGFLFLFGLLTCTVSAQSIQVLLVTGGQAFDTVPFFYIFDEMTDVEYTHFAQPAANRAIADGRGEDFDVLVFCDVWENITAEQKAAYIRLTKQGKPFLFLHNSLMSYQNWSSFEELVGGRFVKENKRTPEDEWSHSESDVWVYSNVENYTPVTIGFRELRFFDEVYDNIRILDAVKPLLRTRHPKSAEYIAWENRFNASTIVYIQPGHDKRTFENEDYKKLLLQAIKYLNTSTN